MQPRYRPELPRNKWPNPDEQRRLIHCGSLSQVVSTNSAASIVDIASELEPNLDPRASRYERSDLTDARPDVQFLWDIRLSGASRWCSSSTAQGTITQ